MERRQPAVAVVVADAAEDESAEETEADPAEEATLLEGPPRPPGTPAEAAPTEGAVSWLLSSLSAEHAELVGPGSNVEAVLVLNSAQASEVDLVPDDTEDWGHGGLRIEFEVRLEGAATASGTQLSGSFELSPSGEARVELPLMVAFSLDGVQMHVRFFAGGYEVGRGHVVVPGRSGTSDAGLGTQGIIAIPDTVLS
mgnify:CR=1 FL=1